MSSGTACGGPLGWVDAVQVVLGVQLIWTWFAWQLRLDYHGAFVMLVVGLALLLKLIFLLYGVFCSASSLLLFESG